MRLTFPRYVSWLAASMIFTLVSLPLLAAQVLRIPVTDDVELVIWKSHWVGRFHWLVWVAAIVLPVGTLTSSWAAKPRYPVSGGAASPKFAEILLPACLLPIIAPLILLQGLVPDSIVSNGVFFVPVFSLSWMLHRWLDRKPSTRASAGRRGATLAVVLSALCFAALGLYFTRTIGAHSGDEGHYLIQADSLYYDRDLDIKNQLMASVGPEVLAEKGLRYFHVSPHSRGGHWYSWHAFGLSLLLAPTVPLGDSARHLVLGIIAALGSLGMYTLSRRLSASHRASLVVTITFSAGLYWGIYSARALPEVLGATLLVWLFWSIAAYPESPSRAALCALLCSSYLPWVQTRFLPLGAVGAGLFVLRVSLASRERRQRLKILAGFCGPYLVGGAIYALVQVRLFETGLPLPTQRFILAYPAGALWSIAGSRGLLYSLPLFAWMIAAHVTWMTRDRGHRSLGAGILAIFFVNMLFATIFVGYRGGASLPGRYHLCVVPLLVPACALTYERTNGLARWWFLFLGLMSTGILILTVGFLSDLGNTFSGPVEPLGIIQPVLRGLFQPYSDEVRDVPSTGANFAGLGFVMVLLGGTFALIRLPCSARPTATGLVTAVVLSASLAHLYNATLPDFAPVPKDTVAAELLALDAAALWFPRPLRSSPTPVFEVSDLFAGELGNTRVSRITTVEDLSDGPGMLIQPRIPAADRIERGYRWTTLIDPFKPGQGGRLLWVEGRVSGSASAVIAIRQGSRILLEQPLPVLADHAVGESLAFQTRRRGGDLYVLARLEGGPGTFHITALRFTPFSPRFAEQGGLLAIGPTPGGPVPGAPSAGRTARVASAAGRSPAVPADREP